jgi:hypothetical protein
VRKLLGPVRPQIIIIIIIIFDINIIIAVVIRIPCLSPDWLNVCE